MPRLVEGCEVSAHLLPARAARWGLKPGIPVAGGGGDNAASAAGIGAVHPGQGFVSLGTSGLVFLASDRFRPNPASAMHAFCHALPNAWHQMSVMLSAASTLRWARELLGLRDGWASMHTAPGEVAQRSLVGGGARSALWATLIASTLGVPLVTHEGGEAGGALGAARLAWLAAGGDLGSICVNPPERDPVEPDVQLVDLLGPRCAQFRRPYPALRSQFGNRG